MVVSENALIGHESARNAETPGDQLARELIASRRKQ
jgi:hypothetical protein